MVSIGTYWWYQESRYQYYLQTPVDATSTKDISFIIKKGDTPATMGENLLTKDLVLDKDAFLTYLRRQNFDRKIIAGRFFLKQSMTIPEIAAKITDSKQGEVILTVPEGSTIEDIDAKLADLDVLTAGVFIRATKDFDNYEKYPFLDKEKIQVLPHPLEGFLFPDTYFLDPNHFSAQDLISLMLNNFKKKLAQADLPNSKLKDKSVFEIIIMASMLEKEVRTTKDIPIVSGILWKRLENNWQLGADATLLYLKNDQTISKSDLAEDSPYNTRRKTGLPPGPISNPGLKSIIGAANPEDSEYFYYLTKPGTGEVVYGRTNDEHNQNKAKYLN